MFRGKSFQTPFLHNIHSISHRVSDQLQCFLKTAIQSTKCIRSVAGYAAVFLTNAGFLMAGGYISKRDLGKS